MTKEEKEILDQAEAIKKKQAIKKSSKKNGRFMKGTLICIFLFLLIYVGVNMFVFYRTSAEPSTLTACVFAFCGLEGGLLGWIKTSKHRSNNNKSKEDDNNGA